MSTKRTVKFQVYYKIQGPYDMDIKDNNKQLGIQTKYKKSVVH